MRAMSDGTFRGLVTTFEVNQPVNDSGHTEVPESEESRAGVHRYIVVTSASLVVTSSFLLLLVRHLLLEAMHLFLVAYSDKKFRKVKSLVLEKAFLSLSYTLWTSSGRGVDT